MIVEQEHVIGAPEGVGRCQAKAQTMSLLEKARIKDPTPPGPCGGHPDFEQYGAQPVTLGIVEELLGADQKPVYSGIQTPKPMTTGKTEFDQWYRNTPGVNQFTEWVVPLSPLQGQVVTYSNSQYFPIDGQLFGDSTYKGQTHNFHFTTELHTQFAYAGGEVFTFTGDDDLWVFINGRLAVDLGGVHYPATGSVSLDAIAAAFGLTVGQTYPLDLFNAERHAIGSNFRIDTSIGFSNCEPIIIY